MNRISLKQRLEKDVPKLKGKNIWIWGAGHTAQLYQAGLARVEKLEICGYCDSNSDKWGKLLSGYLICSPQKLLEQEKICVLICTPQEKVVYEVGHWLDKQKIEWYRLDETILKLYREEILECYDMLDTDISREVYAHIIECRMNNIMPDDKYIFENPYFCVRPFRAYGEEVFIDCGAYVGDSIEQYIWKKPSFAKIVGFEPDKHNFLAMQKRVKRLREEWNISEEKIALYCYGVGAENKKIAFDSTENMSSMVHELEDIDEDKAAGEEIEIVSLDDFMKEPYSFLKADIESMEYAMLQGAKNGIKKYRPLLAICIYHNAVDLFSIQQLIHSYVPEYKFAIRHHSITFDETILYAYIE